MASEETSSISRGCFLFNPKAKQENHGSKSKARKKRSRQTAKRIFQGDTFPSLQDESSKLADLRYRNFQECWSRMFQQIEDIQIETNRKVFSDLVEYIKKSHKNERTHSIRREIPTAALLTGMNMPDHEVIFQQIMADISKDITPHVALLHSKDCSNMKFLLREVLMQLMASNEEENGMGDDLDKSFIEDAGKLKQFSLSALKSWYEAKSKISTDKQPVVIIFEDFEGFSKPVLQDFIQICGEYADSIPIAFVFSLATTIAAVHRSLPHSVSTRLSMEKFQAEPSLECLHAILNKVFLTSDHPFKLGPKMSHLLFDKFLCQDFSIQNFANAVQLSLLEHFYNNPLSILCTYNEEVIYANIDNLVESHLGYVRQSPSFQRYSDRKSLTGQKNLQSNNFYLKEIVKEMLEDLCQLKSTLFPILKCLHVLTSKLPGNPFGKRLKDVYEFCLEQELVKSDVYHNSMALMKQTSRDDLLSALKSCYAILQDSNHNQSYIESFDEMTRELDVLISRFDELDELQRKKNESDASQSSSKPVKIPTYKNRFELQERMRQAVQEKKSTPYDKLRSDIVSFWDKIFRKYLRCPMKLPLHEVMFFDCVDLVSPLINATPRLAVQTALKNPCGYLKCKCCRIDPGDNQETLPDVSIAYKIHLECGRMINVYDWMQAFVSVADPCPPTSRKNSKKRQAEDEKLQARFIQSVSELQLLGFIKPTKRKTDHVQRLTWGL